MTGKETEIMDTDMDYVSDPLYGRKEAIRNLELEFHDGIWWKSNQKCVPKANQEDIIAQFWSEWGERGNKIVTKEIRKEYFWPNLAKDVKEYERTHEIVTVGKRKRVVIERVVPSLLSRALNWLARYCAVKVDKLSKRNVKRLNMMLSIGNGHQLEATLIHKLLKIYDYKVIALEYLIDDGLLNRQQHGDVLFLHEGKLIVVECKHVHGLDKRRKMVFEQAERCARRIQSWIDHLSRFDESFEKLAAWEILPAIFTEESDQLVFLNQIDNMSSNQDESIELAS